MKRVWKKILILLGVIVVLMLGLTVYSHVRYDRSVSSTIVERILWTMKDVKTTKQAETELLKKKKAGEKPYRIDSGMKFDVPLNKSDFMGMDCYSLNEKKNTGTVILYIHGGGYVNQPLIQHWQMLNKVAKTTNAKIVVPIYPLAPFATYKESYHLLDALYRSLLSDKKTRKVVLMGDSAGEGLALGLSETFKEKNISQPDALVLLSPWVDVIMSNPDIEKYQDIDPMLDRKSLIVYGKYWAADSEPKNYQVSPLYGDLSGLKNVTIFVGTREQFYPDIMKLDHKLKEAGVKTTLYKGIGQNHVYPCIPTSEGRNAVKTIETLIQKF